MTQSDVLRHLQLRDKSDTELLCLAIRYNLSKWSIKPCNLRRRTKRTPGPCRPRCSLSTTLREPLFPRPPARRPRPLRGSSNLYVSRMGYRSCPPCFQVPPPPQNVHPLFQSC